MFKKYMCLVLCLIMALSTASTTASAASLPVDGLSASAVTFTDGADEPILDLPETAATVKASVKVNNKSGSNANVIFWLGKYVDDVLVDVKFTKAAISGNATDQVVTVSMDNVSKLIGTKQVNNKTVTYDRTILKAYVWTGFFGAKALAKPAAIPSVDDGIFMIKNGEIWNGFNVEIKDYSITLPRTEPGTPTYRLIAKDNKVDIVQPDVYRIPGENIAKVTDKEGNVTTYKFTIVHEQPKVYNLSMGGEAKTKWNHIELAATPLKGGDALYLDRNGTYPVGWRAVYLGENMKGLTTVLYDQKPGYSWNGADKSVGQTVLDTLRKTTDETFFSFTPSEGGKIYVASMGRLDHYLTKGWTLITDGTSPATPSGYTNMSGNSAGAFLRDLEASKDLSPSTHPYFVGMCLYTDENDILGYAMPYVYEKEFNAWENVVVPTQENGGVSITSFIRWNAPVERDETDASLASLSYNTGSMTATVDGFTSGTAERTFNVTLPVGTTQVTIEAFPKFGNDENEDGILDNVTVPAEPIAVNPQTPVSATVTSTSIDGATTNTYTINFIVEKEIKDIPNKIYNFETKSSFGIYSDGDDNNGAYLSSELKDSNVGKYAIQDGIVEGTSIAYGDRSSFETAFVINKTGLADNSNTTLIRRVSYGELNVDKNMSFSGGTESVRTSYGLPFYSTTDDTNSPWISFNVSSGASVYVAALEEDVMQEAWANNAGWELVEGAAPQVGNVVGKLYQKYYKAGEKVEIPNFGRPAVFATPPATKADAQNYCANIGSFYFVKWSTADGSLSTDATLGSIRANGVMVEGFEGNVDQKQYTVTVSQSTPSVDIVARATNGGATVTYNNLESCTVDMTSVAPGQSAAPVLIKVVAEDGTTTMQAAVTVTKSAIPQDIATLDSLTYIIGDSTQIKAVDGFAATDAQDTNEYNVILPTDTAKVTLDATATDVHGASVSFDPANKELEFDINDYNFANRQKTITVTVTAEDNTTVKVFKVNFTSPVKLKLTSTKVNDKFKINNDKDGRMSGYMVYLVNEPLTETSQVYTNQSDWKLSQLGKNLKELNLLAASPGGSWRPFPSNSDGSTDPTLNSTVYYAESTPGEALYSFVAPEAGTLYILAQAEYPTYTDEYGEEWEIINSGTSNPIKDDFYATTSRGNAMSWCYKLNFEMGETVDIPCVNNLGGGTYTTPVVLVKWASQGISDDASITDIKVNGTSATKNGENYEFVATSGENVTVSVDTTSSWATVSVTPETVTPTVSGTPVTIKVKAENGTQSVYNLTVKRDPSTLSADATFSSIKANGVMVEGFDGAANNKSYAITVSQRTTSVDIVAETTNSGATVTYDNLESCTIDMTTVLPGQSKTVSIKSVAENETAIMYATVTVTKSATLANIATLNSLTYTIGDSTEVKSVDGFAFTDAQDINEYNVTLPTDTAKITLDAIATDVQGASVVFDPANKELVFDITDDNFANRQKTITVTVTAEDNTTVKVFKVNFTSPIKLKLTTTNANITVNNEQDITKYKNGQVTGSMIYLVNEPLTETLPVYTNRPYWTLHQLGKNLKDLNLLAGSQAAFWNSYGGKTISEYYKETTPGEALYSFVAPEAGTLYVLASARFESYLDGYGRTWELINDGQVPYGPDGETALTTKMSERAVDKTKVTNAQAPDTITPRYADITPYNFEPSVSPDGSNKHYFYASVIHGTTDDYIKMIAQHKAGEIANPEVYVDTNSAYNTSSGTFANLGGMPYCYKLDFEMGEKVDIPCLSGSIGGLDRAPIVLVKWASKKTSDTSITDIKVNGRSATKNGENYEFITASSANVTVSATATSSWATVSVSPETITPTVAGTPVAITVKAEDGTQKVYNLTVKLIDQQDTVLEVTTASTVDPAIAPLANNGNVYSDIDTVKVTSYSNYFEGSTLISPASTDGGAVTGVYFGEADADWLSFLITSPARVYFVDSYADEIAGSEWVNKPTGWNKVTSQYLLNLTTSEWTASSSASSFYYKDFAAGERVDIPNYGKPSAWGSAVTDAPNPPVVIIRWNSITSDLEQDPGWEEQEM